MSHVQFLDVLYLRSGNCVFDITFVQKPNTILKTLPSRNLNFYLSHVCTNEQSQRNSACCHLIFISQRKGDSEPFLFPCAKNSTWPRNKQLQRWNNHAQNVYGRLGTLLQHFFTLIHWLVTCPQPASEDTFHYAAGTNIFHGCNKSGVKDCLCVLVEQRSENYWKTSALLLLLVTSKKHYGIRTVHLNICFEADSMLLLSSKVFMAASNSTNAALVMPGLVVGFWQRHSL